MQTSVTLHTDLVASCRCCKVCCTCRLPQPCSASRLQRYHLDASCCCAHPM